MGVSAPSPLFRLLPSVDELLRLPEITSLIGSQGQGPVTDAVRAVLAGMRSRITAGEFAGESVANFPETALNQALAGISAEVEREVRMALKPSLRKVINATGVILHTNLGRAPLGGSALSFLQEIASGYCNLEFDLETGSRGKRDVHLQRLFQRLFAEEGLKGRGDKDSKNDGEAKPEGGIGDLATVIVNNNAAAVMLTLNSLADGGEVIVSRGELVEIGGSFRIPDVMAKSGAVLREVGTTNRTRVADYERAITEKTRLLLRVHRSNFEITGFTEQPSLAELVALGRERKIPVMEDLGSGALMDLRAVGIRGEASVADAIRAGVDLLTYSGDKLLGGPQAGIITGRKNLVATIRSNQMFRAFRADKLIYAAMEATLLTYLKGDYDAIPALAMMRQTSDAIGLRAEMIAAALTRDADADVRSASEAGAAVEIVEGESVLGGGAAPAATLPTRLLVVKCAHWSAEELAKRLRAWEPAIVARVEAGRVLLDLRTVFPQQDGIIVAALRQIMTPLSALVAPNTAPSTAPNIPSPGTANYSPTRSS